MSLAMAQQFSDAVEAKSVANHPDEHLFASEKLATVPSLLWFRSPLTSSLEAREVDLKLRIQKDWLSQEAQKTLDEISLPDYELKAVAGRVSGNKGVVYSTIFRTNGTLYFASDDQVRFVQPS
mmetsp:Transcript_18297/g.35841  ORF Transcript_18297/g.35841 Transcript_18297/m.35841 type:complete len:123 (+) Transcript_18297:765-1133(+)